MNKFLVLKSKENGQIAVRPENIFFMNRKSRYWTTIYTLIPRKDRCLYDSVKESIEEIIEKIKELESDSA